MKRLLLVLTLIAASLNVACDPDKTQSTVVEKVTLNKSELQIKKGQQLVLTATVLPSTAINKKVSWDSANKTIATVDNQGTITGVTVGTTTITVTTDDGAKEASCSITVTDKFFPDAIFRESLIALGFVESAQNDIDPENTTNKAKFAETTKLKVTGKKIESIQGIEQFTALTELECTRTAVQSLDLSKNNTLTSVNCSFSAITELILPTNDVLAKLNCNNNFLTSLNVSDKTKLTELLCNNNKLTAITLPNSNALLTLECSDNQLETIDLSKSSTLTKLSCSNNKLTTLTTSAIPAITSLICNGNALTTFDFSKNASLKTLMCYNNKIAKLNIKPITQLDFDTFYCGLQQDNILLQLELTEPQTVAWDLISYKPQNGRVFAGSDKFFPDAAFRKALLNKFDLVEKNGDIDPENKFNKAELAAITQINISDKKITSLKGIEYLTALTSLSCDKNTIITLDLSQNTNLTNLSCSGNLLSELDLSKNTLLKYLYFSETNISKIDLSANLDIEELWCNSAKLKSLDLSKHTKLRQLRCSNNEITALDLTNSPGIEILMCSYNKFSILDVSGMPNLDFMIFLCGSQKDDITLSLTISKDQKANWDSLGSNNNDNKNVIVTVK